MLCYAFEALHVDRDVNLINFITISWLLWCSQTHSFHSQCLFLLFHMLFISHPTICSPPQNQNEEEEAHSSHGYQAHPAGLRTCLWWGHPHHCHGLPRFCSMSLLWYILLGILCCYIIVYVEFPLQIILRGFLLDSLFVPHLVGLVSVLGLRYSALIFLFYNNFWCRYVLYHLIPITNFTTKKKYIKKLWSHALCIFLCHEF